MSSTVIEFEYCGTMYTVTHHKNLPVHQPNETDPEKMSWHDSCWIDCDLYCGTIEALVKDQELSHFQNPKRKLIVPSIVVSRICSWARKRSIKV
jgi:hypothetical protein